MASRNLNTVVEHLRRTLRCQHGDWTDAQLLDRYLSRRDELAFEVLVWRHGATVLGVCQRVLRDAHAAEDAFQATFLVLVRKARSIGKRQSVGSWLYKVAYRVALRAKARSGRLTELADSESENRTEDVAWRELRPVIDEEVSRLPEKYRTPFVLHHLEGKGFGTIAQEIGFSKATVSLRLVKARELLRKRLVRRGITLGGGLAALSEGSVTARLVDATVKAATGFASGGAVPAEAASLAEGTLNAMLQSKIKLMAATLLAVVGLGGSLGVAFHSDKPGSAPPAAKAVANAPRKKLVNIDHRGEPLPEGALARLGKLQIFPQGRVRSLAFAPDQKSVVTYDLAPHVWDASTGQEVGKFPDRSWPDFGLAYYTVSPDCKHAAIEAGDGVRVVDLTTGHGQDLKGRAGEEFVRFMAFSPDNRVLATVGGPGKDDRSYVRLWQVATGKEIQSFEGGGPVAFSPDGKFLACGTLVSRNNGGWVQGMRMLASFKSDRQSISIWDVAKQRKVRQFKKLSVDGSRHDLQFSPDGRTLAYHTDGPDAFHLWEVESGRPKSFRLSLPKGQKEVNCFGFSPDGKTLATGGYDGVVRLWEVATGQQRRTLVGHIGYVECLNFSPDGRKLASGSQDTTGLIWDVTVLAGGGMESAWNDLAGSDAKRAYQGIWRLTTWPNRSVAWVGERVKAIEGIPDREFRQALGELESSEFRVRQQAEDRLERWGEQATPALRAWLEKKPSLESRRRVEQLLKRLEGPVSRPAFLQRLRAVEVLEQIGTPEAKRALERLAQGVPDARLTREAKASLDRMSSRFRSQP